jgi:plastocyanin
MRMMKSIRNVKSDDFTWGAVAFFAAVSMMTFGGASESPANAAGSPMGQASQVEIKNSSFSPAVVKVKKGTQVTWMNRDQDSHTVDSTQGTFQSGALDTNDRFQFRFLEAGEYSFHCRDHPMMTGKILVQP